MSWGGLQGITGNEKTGAIVANSGGESQKNGTHDLLSEKKQRSANNKQSTAHINRYAGRLDQQRQGEADTANRNVELTGARLYARPGYALVNSNIFVE